MRKLKEQITGNAAMVFHGSKEREVYKYICEGKWECFHGVYGSGLYSVYKLKDTRTQEGGYGKYVLKLYIRDLSKYWCFNWDNFQKVHPIWAKHTNEDEFIDYQAEKFRFKECTYPKKLGDIYDNYKSYPKFLETVDGIVYHGEQDGDCILSYNPYNCRPLAISADKGKTWNKIDKEYIQQYKQTLSNPKVNKSFYKDINISDISEYDNFVKEIAGRLKSYFYKNIEKYNGFNKNIFNDNSSIRRLMYFINKEYDNELLKEKLLVSNDEFINSVCNTALEVACSFNYKTAIQHVIDIMNAYLKHNISQELKNLLIINSVVDQSDFIKNINYKRLSVQDKLELVNLELPFFSSSNKTILALVNKEKKDDSSDKYNNAYIFKYTNDINDFEDICVEDDNIFKYIQNIEDAYKIENFLLKIKNDDFYNGKNKDLCKKVLEYFSSNMHANLYDFIINQQGSTLESFINYFYKKNNKLSGLFDKNNRYFETDFSYIDDHIKFLFSNGMDLIDIVFAIINTYGHHDYIPNIYYKIEDYLGSYYCPHICNNENNKIKVLFIKYEQVYYMPEKYVNNVNLKSLTHSINFFLKRNRILNDQELEKLVEIIKNNDLFMEKGYDSDTFKEAVFKNSSNYYGNIVNDMDLAFSYFDKIDKNLNLGFDINDEIAKKYIKQYQNVSNKYEYLLFNYIDKYHIKNLLEIESVLKSFNLYHALTLYINHGNIEENNLIIMNNGLVLNIINEQTIVDVTEVFKNDNELLTNISFYSHFFGILYGLFNHEQTYSDFSLIKRNYKNISIIESKDLYGSTFAIIKYSNNIYYLQYSRNNGAHEYCLLAKEEDIKNKTINIVNNRGYKMTDNDIRFIKEILNTDHIKSLGDSVKEYLSNLQSKKRDKSNMLSYVCDKEKRLKDVLQKCFKENIDEYMTNYFLSGFDSKIVNLSKFNIYYLNLINSNLEKSNRTIIITDLNENIVDYNININEQDYYDIFHYRGQNLNLALDNLDSITVNKIIELSKLPEGHVLDDESNFILDEKNKLLTLYKDVWKKSDILQCEQTFNNKNKVGQLHLKYENQVYYILDDNESDANLDCMASFIQSQFDDYEEDDFYGMFDDNCIFDGKVNIELLIDQIINYLPDPDED